MRTAQELLAEIRGIDCLTERLTICGQPTAEQFAAVKAAGYGVVVNLVPPLQPSYLCGEEAIVNALGMQYVGIPVEWTEPTFTALGQFFAAMDDFAGRKVLVHCAANKRAAVFTFLYRVLRQGMDVADAEDEMERTWVPEGVWREFLEEALLKGGK